MNKPFKQYTLIELIAGVVILVIVGTGVAVFISGVLQNMNVPRELLSQRLELRSVAAKIRDASTTVYQNDVEGLQTAIGATGSNQNNGFGNYRVISNSFIQLNVSADVYSESGAGSATDYLKVVIGSVGAPDSITLLFRGNGT